MQPSESEERLAAAFAEADVMMGFVERTLSERLLNAMGNMKLVQLLSAGYDKVDTDAMRKSGLPVATNGGANAVAVAEHAIMSMLAVSRKLVELNTKVRNGEWRSGSLGTGGLHEIAGQTVGLLGMGMIGREVSKRLACFEASVIYHDIIRIPPADEERLSVRYVSLDDLLESADIVSLHVPLTPQTRHIIGRAQLDRMKRSAILVNTARGGLIDPDALYEALSDGRIAGAGLDTVEPEPPAPDNPLLSLPNAIVTPHTAGPTVESLAEALAQCICQYQARGRG